MGNLDPFTMQEFPACTPEEEKIIDKVARRKNNPTPSFKSLVICGDNPAPPQEMPKFLKNNPHPHYLDLWNKHPKLFWKEYNTDKVNGTVKWMKKPAKPKQEQLDFKDLNFKKILTGQKKKRQNPDHNNQSDNEEGFSPKASKAAKLKSKLSQDQQLQHDLEI